VHKLVVIFQLAFEVAFERGVSPAKFRMQNPSRWQSGQTPHHCLCSIVAAIRHRVSLECHYVGGDSHWRRRAKAPRLIFPDELGMIKAIAAV
jgi:hypothetical protein